MATATVNIPLLDSGDNVTSYLPLVLNTASAPTSAVLQNGGTVFAWSTAPYFVSQRVNFSIYGMVVNSAGVAGQPFVIATAPTNRYGDHLYYSPNIVSLSDGGFAVVYEDAASTGLNRGIILKRFDSFGNAVGGQLLVGKDPDGPSATAGGLSPSVTATGNGSYQVSWNGRNGSQSVSVNESLFGIVSEVATPTEGGSTTIVISAHPAASGAVVDYTIQGIQSSDVGVNLSGTVVVGSDGKARLTVPIVSDVEVENESMTVNALGFSVTVPILDSSQATQLQPVCFLEGTQIQLISSSSPVDSIVRGQEIAAFKCQTVVKWIGRQRRTPEFAQFDDYLPVKICAGALEENVPVRDLYLSPDHAVLVDGHLIHAQALVNGRTIIKMTEWEGDIEYYHIETENHEIIFAEGVPCETFIDNVSREQFDNYAEYQALYPYTQMMRELPLPRVKFRRQIPSAIWRRLMERADLITAAQDQA